MKHGISSHNKHGLIYTHIVGEEIEHKIHGIWPPIQQDWQEQANSLAEFDVKELLNEGTSDIITQGMGPIPREKPTTIAWKRVG